MFIFILYSIETLLNQFSIFCSLSWLPASIAWSMVICKFQCFCLSSSLLYTLRHSIHHLSYRVLDTNVTQRPKTRRLSFLAFLFYHILYCICFKVPLIILV